ncbi:MBL fold metallo-hydrolase [Olivibacter sitiensis]|uniref:MBL fold metallo-hydrolase n=1 Tax=Olivibacter sitiensis TaxID=376470 RepID=UPI000483A9AF|nr:MBL fold metallo-hydrolase [Olivibacter sitiensis]
MSLSFASINSGSNGNCYYVGNEHEAVLVDAGISCREIEKRMRRMGLDMHKVKAIFISHEHTDHIRGLCTLTNKYQLPVYITDGTLNACRLAIPSRLLHSLSRYPVVQIGNLTVQAFQKYHDAADPYSFTVEQNDFTVGVFTDLGRVCDNLIAYFGRCHAAFLEANYDEDMLINGRYPYFLKHRIRGGHGHLSNAQALDLFLQHRSPRLSHLLLSHLSKDNNDPQLVLDLFAPHRGSTQVSVASRYEESAVFSLGEVEKPVVQMALFPDLTSRVG